MTVALSAVLSAQWLRQPTASIPRTADGKPNLSAPAPQTADGKPDLSFHSSPCRETSFLRVYSGLMSSSPTSAAWLRT